MMNIKHKTGRQPRTVAMTMAHHVPSDSSEAKNITKAEKPVMNTPTNRSKHRKCLKNAFQLTVQTTWLFFFFFYTYKDEKENRKATTDYPQSNIILCIQEYPESSDKSSKQ